MPIRTENDQIVVVEVVLAALCGYIGTAINEAIEVSKSTGYSKGSGALVKFEFNGVRVAVRSDSDPELIFDEYLRALKEESTEQVGPYPSRGS
jgi:hypothetical protein